MLAVFSWTRPAAGQIIPTNFMGEREFNASDCDSDESMQVTFAYTTAVMNSINYELFSADAATVLDIEACFRTPRSEEEIDDGSFRPGAENYVVDLVADHEVSVGDFLAPICDDDGYRGYRVICMMVGNPPTNVTGNGVVFQVDTQVPGVPTGVSWKGGDKAIILNAATLPGGIAVNEPVNYVVELRPCSGAGDVEVDAGTRSDGAGGVDSAAGDVDEQDATVEDSGLADAMEDGGLEDATVEDGGLEDATVEDGGLEDAPGPLPDVAKGGDDPDAGSDDQGDEIDAGEVDAGDEVASLCGASAAFSRVKVAAQLPITVTGQLVNGSSYEVRLRIEDSAGNLGPASDPAVVTPRVEFGIWDIYDGGGWGTGCAGCAAAPAGSAQGGWLLLLGGLLLGLRRAPRRRVRRAWVVLALISGLLLSSAVWAETDPTVGVRLGAGPYQPDIDTEPGANDLYRCVFDNKTWVLLTTGLDYILFDRFGTLTLGGEVAYFMVNGRERTSLPTAGSCGSGAASRATLHLLPLSANLHYRFDWPYHEFGFPLAPYARLGANLTLGAITRNGEFESGKEGVGVRTGWQWAAGLALVLDVFDEARMKRVRDDGMFQHAYLFAEYRDMRIDSFGAPGFRLGDQTWLAGIAIDM